MADSAPSLLLLIPAYNEEQRIEPVLREFATYFRDHYPGKFQLVVVLNGCRDNTLGVVQRVAAEFSSIRALEFRAPIGKGGALIEGLRFADQADVVGYVDADGASPPRAFHELVKLLPQADCVIGSRWLPGAVLHQSQTRLRRFTSRCFHFVVEMFFHMHIQDTQCPCKVMRREAVEQVYSTLRIADLAFDVNLLVSLKRAGFKILEVPTEWTDKLGSKVTSSLFRSSLTMFLSVLRLWLIYIGAAKYMEPLSPLSAWAYRTLRAPAPRPDPTESLKEVPTPKDSPSSPTKSPRKTPEAKPPNEVRKDE